MASTIPEDIEGIIRTLAQVYAIQGATREVEILVKSKAAIQQTDYDNWNGGTHVYRLVLQLQPFHYAQIERCRDEIERDMLKRLDSLLRTYSHESIDTVMITLEIENDANWRKNASGWLEKADSGALRAASRSAQYDVFISHASEDKENLVRPLAHALTTHGFKVWYDEFELKIGDSLVASINHGLANSSYGIVVLSKPFFLKNWPQYELEGLTTRQIVGEKVILPIWHGITREDIIRYSPPLADRLAINSEIKNIDQMVAEIAAVIDGTRTRR